jgi:ribonuclease Z
MDLSIVFLGTGGSVPTARRATACLLARVGGERLLFDCGEGSQRQMQRSVGLVQVDEIYITHYHADHYLGVPGLLKTYDLQGRERPLRIVGPPGLADLFKALSRILGRVAYDVELVELEAGEGVRHDGFEVRAFPVDHGVTAHGYALVEDERPGRFDPELAERLGVSPGPDFGRLQGGEPVQGSDGVVEPRQVMGAGRRGRKVVITGDTAPSADILDAAWGADVLVTEATFAEEERERALETLHQTAAQAAEIARGAHVGLLALTHLSNRYFGPEIAREAREIFPDTVVPRDFDVIEVPFAERGTPQLIKGGAKHQRERDPVSSGAQ